MNVLEFLLSHTVIWKVGWVLVHSLWQVAAVGVMLAMALGLLRKASANVRYLVCCGALVLMVALPVVTFWMVAAPANDVVPPVEVEAIESVTVPVVEVAPIDIPLQIEAPLATVTLTTEMPRVSWLTLATQKLETSLPYLVLAWVIGIFGLSLRHLGGWAQLQRLKRRMIQPVADELREKAHALAALLRIGQTVAVVQSALVQVPTVVGWLTPMILLPASALTGLSAGQQEALLAHELAHIRRHDYLVNLFQTAIEILGFYHPVVWWASRRIRIERENCCDDVAAGLAGDRVLYADALTTMEELRGQSRLAMAASGGSLFARIRRLAGKEEGRSKSGWLPAVTALLLVGMMAAPAILPARSKAEADTKPAGQDGVPSSTTVSNEGWEFVASANEHTVEEMLERSARGVMYIENTSSVRPAETFCQRVTFLRGAHSELRWEWARLGTKDKPVGPDQTPKMQYLRHPDATIEAVEYFGIGRKPNPSLYIRRPGGLAAFQSFVLEDWLGIGPRGEWSLKTALERNSDSLEIKNTPDDPEAPWTLIFQGCPSDRCVAEVTVDPKFGFLITRHDTIELESGRISGSEKYTYELREDGPPFFKSLEKTVFQPSGEVSFKFVLTTEDFEWLEETDQRDFDPMNLFSRNAKTINVFDRRVYPSVKYKLDRSDDAGDLFDINAPPAAIHQIVLKVDSEKRIVVNGKKAFRPGQEVALLVHLEALLRGEQSNTIDVRGVPAERLEVLGGPAHDRNWRIHCHSEHNRALYWSVAIPPHRFELREIWSMPLRHPDGGVSTLRKSPWTRVGTDDLIAAASITGGSDTNLLLHLELTEPVPTGAWEGRGLAFLAEGVVVARSEKDHRISGNTLILAVDAGKRSRLEHAFGQTKIPLRKEKRDNTIDIRTVTAERLKTLSKPAHDGKIRAESKRPYLDAGELRELALARQGNIRSLELSLVEETTLSGSPGQYPQQEHMARRLELDRIEDGNRFWCKQAGWWGSERREKRVEAAYDGDTATYYQRSRADLYPATIHWGVEDYHPLIWYTLENLTTVVSAEGKREKGTKLDYLLQNGGVVLPEQEQVAGQWTHVVRLGGGTSILTERVWIAAELGFIPLKCERVFKGEKTHSMEVLKVGSSVGGDGHTYYYPLRAKRISKYGSGAVATHTINVSKYIPNQEFDASRFRVVLPNGTRVTDHRVDKKAPIQFVVGSVQSDPAETHQIVPEIDSQKRVLLNGEQASLRNPAGQDGVPSSTAASNEERAFLGAANERTVAEMLKRPARGVVCLERSGDVPAPIYARTRLLRGPNSELRWEWEMLGPKVKPWGPDDLRRLKQQYLRRQPDGAVIQIQQNERGLKSNVGRLRIHPQDYLEKVLNYAVMLDLEKQLAAFPPSGLSLKDALEQYPNSVEIKNDPKNLQSPWTVTLFPSPWFPDNKHSAVLTVDPALGFLITEHRVMHIPQGAYRGGWKFTYEMREDGPPFLKSWEEVLGRRKKLFTMEDFEWLEEVDPSEFDPIALLGRDITTVLVLDKRVYPYLNYQLDRSDAAGGLFDINAPPPLKVTTEQTH